MDYEKKYKEAIERAKFIHSLLKDSEDSKNYSYVESMEDIFPELAESEDERIMKEIITYLSTAEDKELIPYEDWISWLEKQCEQKYTKKDVDDVYLKGICDTKQELEKQGVKPTNNVEPKFKVGQTIIYKGTENIFPTKMTISDIAVGQYWDDNCCIVPISDQDDWELVKRKPILDVEIPFGKDSELIEEAITIPDGCYAIIEDGKVILRKGEQKPSWSEEDEENLNWFEKFFRAESVIAEGKDIPQDRYLWFKNLKDRVQPKNGWSEEDEETLDYIIAYIEKNKSKDKIYTKKTEILEGMIGWLKSLRPQSFWKPSKEQLIALKCAITTSDEKWVCMNTKDLESLYEQLKKLREE